MCVSVQKAGTNACMFQHAYVESFEMFYCLASRHALSTFENSGAAAFTVDMGAKQAHPIQAFRERVSDTFRVFQQTGVLHNREYDETVPPSVHGAPRTAEVSVPLPRGVIHALSIANDSAHYRSCIPGLKSVRCTVSSLQSCRRAESYWTGFSAWIILSPRTLTTWQASCFMTPRLSHHCQLC